MTQTREKVVLAMSGGVDSSVAACLLVEQGYDVVGVFMRLGSDEATAKDSDEATLDTARQGRRSYCPSPGLQPGRTSAEEGRKDEGTEGRRRKSDEATLDTARQGRRSDEGAASHRGCCSAADAADARFVAGMLGIPFYALNFQGDFDRIIDYFADEYVRGRTPNPCIVCNDQLKFGRLVEYADAVGARYIATGHYARIATRDGRSVLLRGRDECKDQSYVLFGLSRPLLDRALFPVGDLTKAEVRAVAARLGLPNCEKPDSVEICFAPDRDYARVVRERRPEAFVEGDVLDQDGRVIGRHGGIAQFTIGQRRGLRIAAGKPIYVTRLDPAGNAVIMGDDEALLGTALVAESPSFLVDEPGQRFRASVKIRYLHKDTMATVERLAGERIRVVFDEPQRAITPGQAVVFYDGDVVLGGAWIERAEHAAAISA